MFLTHTTRTAGGVSSWTSAVMRAAGVVIASSLAGTGWAATIQGLGTLPGGVFDAAVYGISADGSTVVGEAQSHDDEAYRWRSETGMVGLGDLAGNTNPRSEAWDASADGSVVVGSAKAPAPSFNFEPYRWTEAGGMVALGELPGATRYGLALGTSADASVIVGRADSTAGYQAFRWNATEGMVGLGDLPGGNFDSIARSVSADGSIIVGSSRSTNNAIEAFRWTAAEGIQPLGELGGGAVFSSAWAVSANGQVIVGESSSSATGVNYDEAFRWTAATGMVGLGDLPGGPSFDQVSSVAYDVSADGSVIVGAGLANAGTRAFIWDTANGMRELGTVLTNDYGLDVSGWRLSEARAISDDGSVIAGYGRNLTANRNEGWIVDLSDPGDAEDNPILPANSEPDPDGSWVFNDAPGGGAWFDPIAATGFLYETDGAANFLEVGLPASVPDLDGQYFVSDGLNPPISVAAGDAYTFPSPVMRFTVTGIDPPVDGDDPLAFPTFLVLDQDTVNVTMTPIPEPTGFVLLALALALAVGVAWRRCRREDGLPRSAAQPR